MKANHFVRMATFLLGCCLGVARESTWSAATRSYRRRWLIVALLLLAKSPTASADCDGFAEFGPPTVGNVVWSLADSVTACPAGDTIILIGHHATLHPHPSRLRVGVSYRDANCFPKVGVPPESLTITWSSLGSSARINDKGSVTYADDSTDAIGIARFTFPSLSGCGTLRLRLTVWGVDQGTRDVRIRTVDPDIDLERRVTSVERVLSCDYNWNGTNWERGDSDDLTIFDAHVDHWRRNALHGTPVKRTDLAAIPAVMGGSVLTWSPNNRWLTFTITREGAGAGCKVFVTASNPKDGNYLRQFTFDSTDAVIHRDYDPSWSSNGREIFYDRDDWIIYRKGIPGVAGVSDTIPVAVSSSGSKLNRGDNYPSVSPDGLWIAFGRREQVQESKPWQLWKMRLSDGYYQQLTFETNVADWYPSWSPDGLWIMFQRESKSCLNCGEGPHLLYKIKANGDSLQRFYVTADTSVNGTQSTTPSFAPDGKIVLGAIGARQTTQNVRTHTFDYHLSTPKPIENYTKPEFMVSGQYPTLAPRMSPDGTRTALTAQDLWAVRQNMNKPPKITTVGPSIVADTTAVVSFNAIVGQTLTLTVAATDEDDGARTYHAAYVTEPGMNWTESTRTFAWTNVPGPAGKTYVVKLWVTNGSVTGGSQNGAMDAILVHITTVSSLAQSARDMAAGGMQRVLWRKGPNPMVGAFVIEAANIEKAKVSCEIFDLTGRRLVTLHGTTNEMLKWDGRDHAGVNTAPGIYLYRIRLGASATNGKIVKMD